MANLRHGNRGHFAEMEKNGMCASLAQCLFQSHLSDLGGGYFRS